MLLLAAAVCAGSTVQYTWYSTCTPQSSGAGSDCCCCTAPLRHSSEKLKTGTIGNNVMMPGVNLILVATELYAFLGTTIGASIHKKRLRLAGGERGNGFEL